MRRRIQVLIGAIGLVALLAILVTASSRSARETVIQVLTGQHTISSRLNEFGPAARNRLAPDFVRARLIYPPQQVRLVGVKNARRLEVWASADGYAWALIHTYPILALSGTLGPKLREGDLQAPEGIYPLESLNPNSRFHVALRVGYPNDFDRAHAKVDGRTNLGGDIMIHGASASIGCLAMGDEAAEDLFVLTADVGIGNVTVIVTPVDFRTDSLPADMPTAPAWCADLYDQIKCELHDLTPAAPVKG